jgi:hypothetical protein
MSRRWSKIAGEAPRAPSGIGNSVIIQALLVFPALASRNSSDEDWASAAPACIFAIGSASPPERWGRLSDQDDEPQRNGARGPRQSEGELCEARGPAGLAHYDPGASRPVQDQSHEVELFPVEGYGASPYDAGVGGCLSAGAVDGVESERYLQRISNGRSRVRPFACAQDGHVGPRYNDRL